MKMLDVNEVKTILKVSKPKAYEIIRNTLNISEGRLINVVDVIDGAGNPASVLVIYSNFVSEKERMRLDLEIEVFDFSIFELDYNSKVDIEDIIKRIKNNDHGRDAHLL